MDTLPTSWFLVCASGEIASGQIHIWALPGQSFVLYRGRDSGRLAALSARCAHQGAHMERATVEGDNLRCPMHGWQFGPSGDCRHIPGEKSPPRGVGQKRYPVHEAAGLVLLFNGESGTEGPGPQAPAYPSQPEDGKWTLSRKWVSRPWEEAPSIWLDRGRQLDFQGLFFAGDDRLVSMRPRRGGTEVTFAHPEGRRDLHDGFLRIMGSATSPASSAAPGQQEILLRWQSSLENLPRSLANEI